jgi:hypothetical protein
MRISRAVYPASLVVLLCFVAGAATAVRAADARSTSPAATTSKVAGTLSTHVVINRFKAVGKRVVGRGTVISRYTDAAGVTSTSRKPYWLRISERTRKPHTPQRHTRRQHRSLAAAQQLPLCHILLLEVGEVDLTLAGLHAILKAFNPDEPIQVRIQADQEGGVLGRLFCDLAAGGGALPTVQAAQSAARTLTARTQGNTILRANATVYTPDGIASSSARTMQSARGEATPNAPRAVQVECNVLHLILGPVHLNLLGLVVDINKVVLDLKGIPGTLLGDIFCKLSNDPPPAGGGTTVAGTVSTRMVINRFTAVGKRVVGQGTAVSTYTDKAGATTLQRKSFRLTIAKPSAPQQGSSALQQEALCQVLFLEIGEVDLTLAGLHVTARAFNPEEPIRLQLQAYREGGILGRLFCDLAQGGGVVASKEQAQLGAQSLTKRMSGSTIVRVQATVYAPNRTTSGAGTMSSMRGATGPNAPQAAQVDECHVVHLILGPVHLDLLGLVADLNKIVVDVNAIPGTLLGDIFCLLSSDPPPTPTPTATPTTPATQSTS